MLDLRSFALVAVWAAVGFTLGCAEASQSCPPTQILDGGECVDPCEVEDCDDGNPCTLDVCANEAGVAKCSHPFAEVDVECSLEGAGVCDGEGNCVECNSAAQCPPDDQECTTAICENHQCGQTATMDGTTCDLDEVPGLCEGGDCVEAPECIVFEDCDDKNVCTEDDCVQQRCTHRPVSDLLCSVEPGVPGSCSVGACVGFCEGVVCPPGACIEAGQCDVEDGTCVPGNPFPDGSLCNGGACLAGECGTVFPCTEQGIRDAIQTGGGPFTFSCAGPTTVTTSSVVRIDNDVILDGDGQLTVNGDDRHLVFDVLVDQAVELRGFTVSGGRTGGVGGGIRVDGELVVTSSIIADNYGLHGGGIGVDGVGSLTITDSTVTENTSSGWGGGIMLWTGSSSATVTRVTVSENRADGRGGGLSSYGTLVVRDSTVSGNTTPGGGVGGIQNLKALYITNSTISGNTGPGLYHSGEETQLRSTTLAANSGHALLIGNTGFFANNSIIEGGCEPGAGTAGGQGNIESPDSTCGLNATLNMLNVSLTELSLGPLLPNAASTRTHALVPPSVAINAIEAALCTDTDGTPLLTDQRGVVRPQQTKCDAGSFELVQ